MLPLINIRTFVLLYPLSYRYLTSIYGSAQAYKIYSLAWPDLYFAAGRYRLQYTVQHKIFAEENFNGLNNVKYLAVALRGMHLSVSD